MRAGELLGDGAEGSAGHLGDLLHALAAEVPQHQDHSFLLGKAGHTIEKELRFIVDLAVARRRGDIGGAFDDRHAGPLARHPDRFMPRDPQDPGPECRPVAQRAEMPIAGQEGLLDRVLRGMMVAQDLQRRRMHRPLVASHELCVCVSVTRQNG